MATTIYDYARTRGVNLQPHEVEAYVQGLPAHERQEALLLVLASDAPKTPGHIFPERSADFLREMNTTPAPVAAKAVTPPSEPTPVLADTVTVRGQVFCREDTVWVKHHEFGTLSIRVADEVHMTLQVPSGANVTVSGKSADDAYTNLVATLEDVIVDISDALTRL